MNPAGTSFFAAVADWFSRWIGWGWSLTVLIWLVGAIFILTVVYRGFIARYGSRLPTAAAFLVWTMVVLGIASKILGYGPPGGK